MILTCPDCATSYFVDDARIPRRGRMVKCSSCGARWRALPDGEVEAEPDTEPDIVAEPATPGAAEGSGDELEVVAAPIARRPRPQAKAKRPVGLILGVSAAAVAGIAIAGAVAMRQQVAGVVPALAPAFAMIGLPVDTNGLVLEGVTSKPDFLAGRPVLRVTGAIRNTHHRTETAPPIRISLLDKAGKPMQSAAVDLTNNQIPPGGERYFTINMPDPPAQSRKLEVRFDLTAHHPLAPPAQDAEAVSHEAPTPAQPLPPSSPDALTQHE